MKARNIILTIAAIAVLAAPAAVFSQQGPGNGDGTGSGWGNRGHRGGAMGRHGGGPGDHMGFFERMLPRLAERLELSDEQLEQIQTIVDATRPEIEVLTDQLRTGREEFRASNEDPTVFNEAEFRAHADSQHKIQTEIGVIAGVAKAKVYQVLTPEQREQLQDMRGNFGRKGSRSGAGRRSGS